MVLVPGSTRGSLPPPSASPAPVGAPLDVSREGAGSAGRDPTVKVGGRASGRDMSDNGLLLLPAKQAE